MLQLRVHIVIVREICARIRLGGICMENTIECDKVEVRTFYQSVSIIRLQNLLSE